MPGLNKESEIVYVQSSAKDASQYFYYQGNNWLSYLICMVDECVGDSDLGGYHANEMSS